MNERMIELMEDMGIKISPFGRNDRMADMGINISPFVRNAATVWNLTQTSTVAARERPGWGKIKDKGKKIEVEAE